MRETGLPGSERRHGGRYGHRPAGLAVPLVLIPTAALAWAGTPASDSDGQALIRQRLDLARASAADGDEPFGALLVKDGRVVMRAENTINSDGNAAHHAEINLLAAAYRQYGPKGARGATLYTSREPCPMCCGAIHLMGVSRVVHGPSSHRLSAMSGFGEDLRAEEILGLGQRKVEVTGPVLEEEEALMAGYLKSVHVHGRVLKTRHPHAVGEEKQGGTVSRIIGNHHPVTFAIHTVLTSSS